MCLENTRFTVQSSANLQINSLQVQHLPILSSVATENDNISIKMVESLAAGTMRDFIELSSLLSLERNVKIMGETSIIFGPDIEKQQLFTIVWKPTLSWHVNSIILSPNFWIFAVMVHWIIWSFAWNGCREMRYFYLEKKTQWALLKETCSFLWSTIRNSQSNITRLEKGFSFTFPNL